MKIISQVEHEKQLKKAINIETVIQKIILKLLYNMIIYTITKSITLHYIRFYR